MTDVDAKRELLVDIERAFEGVSVAPDDFLSNAEFEFLGLPGPVDAETQRIDWRKIDPEWINYNYDALAFCYYPLEFQFLLPAYMTFATTHPRTETNVPDFIVYALLPDRRQKYRYNALTRDQCQAICRFLNYLLCSERDGYVLPELPKALAHWTKRCESLSP